MSETNTLDFSLESIKKIIEDQVPGALFSLSFSDGKKNLMEWNPDQPVVAASTVKVLILLAAYYKTFRKELDLGETYTLIDADKVGGSGSIKHVAAGESFSLKQLAEKMMWESDNVASNILLKKVGLNCINDFAGKIGLKTTRFERLFMDVEARNLGHENKTTAREMNMLLQKIANKDIAMGNLGDEIVHIMELVPRKRMAALIPSSVVIGHKSGGLDTVRNDAGWMKKGNKVYFLSIFVHAIPAGKEKDAEHAISNISHFLYAKF